MKKLFVVLSLGILPFSSYACRDLLGQYQCKDYVMEISKNFLGYRLIEGNYAPIKLKCEENALTYTGSVKEDGVTLAIHGTLTRTEQGVHVRTIATLEGIPIYYERSDCNEMR